MLDNTAAANAIVDALAAHGVTFDNLTTTKSDVAAILNDWNGSTSNSTLAQRVSSLVSLLSARDQDISDWARGTVSGGPTSNGVYPITIQGGGTVNVKCPARLVLDAAGFTFKGSVANSTALAAITGMIEGDTYVVSSPTPQHLWAWSSTTSAWVDLGVAGAPGATGPATEWQASAGYLQYRAVGGSSWTNVVTLASISGTNGIDGRTVLNGSADPSSGTGANGDFYVNTTSKMWFGPKAAGVWPAGISLTGLTGADGVSAGRLFTFSSTNTDADPGAGGVRINNSTIGSVTRLFFNNAEKGGADVSAWLDAFAASSNPSSKGELELVQVNDPTKFASFSVTGATLSGSGYRKAVVTYIDGPGGFTNGATVAAAFYRAGDQGNAGSGSGDVGGPGTNHAGWVPTWNGANSKTLSDGRAIGVASSTDIPDRAAADTRYLLLSGGTMTGPVLLNADATANLHPVSYQQFQAALLGQSKRTTVRVATTGASITIATALNNGSVIDGVTLATGDRVLVKDQSTQSQNGVYIVGASPARSVDFDTWTEHPGMLLAVEEGAANADTLWLCTSNEGGTLGTTALTFSKAGFTAYTAGEGLTLVSFDFRLNVPGLAEDTAPDGTADFLLTWDTSAGAHKKVKPQNLPISTAVQTALNLKAPAADPAFTGTVDVQGAIKLSGDISPTSLAANQNDYGPTGHATAAILRLTSSAAVSISGLQGGADGVVKVLQNIGSNEITLLNENTGSATVGNRFSFGADYALAPSAAVLLVYDVTISRWRLTGPPLATVAEIWQGATAGKVVAPKTLFDAQVPQTLTDAATVAWNMALGWNAKVTLGGNRTIGTPTNPKRGMSYILEVAQDATGTRVPILPSSTVFDFGDAGPPTFSTAASKVDTLVLYCTDAAAPKFTASFKKAS